MPRPIVSCLSTMPGRSTWIRRASRRSRTERCADCGDLVLGLEGADAEVLVARELLEHRRRGRDRVRAEKERQAGLHRRGDQPIGERLVSRDVAVEARLERGRLDLVLHRECLGRLPERVAGLKRLHVRLRDLRPLRELATQELDRPFGRAAVKPRHQSEREHVLGALCLALGDPFDLLQRLDRHRGERDRVHLVRLDRPVLERVAVVAGLLQVPVREGVLVDDEDPLGGRSLRFVFNAAGFIATSTFGASPGVRMSWSAKWSWKPETPGSEPAGARISAGKSGKLARSFPSIAVSEVNRPPVSCIPSPESPANRITTDSSCSTGFEATSRVVAQIRAGSSARCPAQTRPRRGCRAGSTRMSAPT